MDNDVQIKLTATATDTEMIRSLFRSYRDAYMHDIEFAKYVADESYETELAQLPHPYLTPGGLILATHDGKACGGLGLKPFAEGVLELKRMYLFPEYRRKGLAQQLITFAQAHARQVQAIHTILLDTVPALFPGAHELYTKMGFTEIAPYWNSPLAGTVYMRYDVPQG